MRRDAVVIHEAYFGGTDASTPHDVRSVTKTVTALLIGEAIRCATCSRAIWEVQPGTEFNYNSAALHHCAPKRANNSASSASTIGPPLASWRYRISKRQQNSSAVKPKTLI